jgi:glycolate dehydrogenase iron-sulfur subunit
MAATPPETPLDALLGRAWDEHHPPAPELIDDCVHCGFCLPTCPTYALWGEEMDSPRGRITLMALGHEQSELSEQIVGHFDSCLGCMACVTACPSGVQYDLLLAATRSQIERNHERGAADRAFRRLIFALFPHPGRLRALVPALVLNRRLQLDRLIPARFPRLRAMAAIAPPVSLDAAWQSIPAVTPAVGERRGTVVILQGCVQRVFFAGVNRATVAVLAAEGFEVHAPRAPRCCGSLAMHTGYEDDAKACARETIAAFAAYDTVIVNAAGCGSGIKEYGHLLGAEPGAQALAGRVQDIHEFLAAIEPRATRHPVALRVAYHDACHLAHAQGIRAAPRELLRSIPGLELVEPAEWEICCGSAGVHNLLEPAAARELGLRKAANLAACGAQAIAAANPGCSIQIARYLEQPVPILHPIELLARSIAG